LRLNIPGFDLKNVCVLRSFADADAMIETARCSRRDRATASSSPTLSFANVKRSDGTAVFPALGNNFRCLQQSGDWCNN
jgi:hypothetical protein